MSIKIEITGNHATDLIAQINTLYEAFNPQPIETPQTVNPNIKQANYPYVGEERQSQKDEKQIELFPDEPEQSERPEKPKKLVGKQHKIEADKMIAEGKKNDLYPLLSFAQKNRVDEALGIKPKPEKEPEFTPPPVERKADVVEDKKQNVYVKKGEVIQVNKSTLRDLITEKCVDENGKDVPEKYASITKIMRNAIPSVLDVKISNIPENKIPEVYYEIAAL